MEIGDDIITSADFMHTSVQFFNSFLPAYQCSAIHRTA